MIQKDHLLLSFLRLLIIDEPATFTDSWYVAELPQGHRVRGGEGDGEEELHHGD